MPYPAELLRKQIIRYFLFISEPSCPGIPTREFLEGNSHITLQGCQSQVQASCESQWWKWICVCVCVCFGFFFVCLFACFLAALSLHHSAWTPHCGARASLTVAQGVAPQRADPNFPTGGRPRVSCIGKQILNHWTTREVLRYIVNIHVI